VIILGAGGTAAAIAFGIGGIQPARTLLEKYTKGGTQPPQ
jgi:shikimate 5-dehydrogenase